MKTIIVLPLLFIPMVVTADDNFANNREEILKKLTSSNASVTSQNTNKRKTRSIRGLKAVSKQASTQVLTENGAELISTLPTTSSNVNLKIEFDVNSARIRQSSYKLLNQLGQALTDRTLSKAQFLVGGHTDSDGSDESNFRLSLKRARAVKSFLVDAVGISGNRLKIVGYGENTPIKSNVTRFEKQKNRRVEILKIQ
jgi:OmpA-OmpF porin, OOP family